MLTLPPGADTPSYATGTPGVLVSEWLQLLLCFDRNTRWPASLWKIEVFKNNCPKKSKFFKNLPEKIVIFWKFALKNPIFLKLPEKVKFCWPGSTTSQISNQIDAAGRESSSSTAVRNLKAYSTCMLYASFVRGLCICACARLCVDVASFYNGPL